MSFHQKKKKKTIYYDKTNIPGFTRNLKKKKNEHYKSNTFDRQCYKNIAANIIVMG